VSSVRAQRLILERLASGTGVLLALLLDLGEPTSWCDGLDAEGRAILLVGRHQLGDSEDAQQVIATVLQVMAAGQTPDGVHVVAYAPKASEALAEIVAGESTEVLVDGPRGTGKTQVTAGAVAALAELHARAGHPLPLKALWLHDSLKSAGAKTARSLEQPQWTGVWGLRDDRTVAVCTVGGVEHVLADFVAVQDPTAKERLKAECHVVLAEEVVPSLSEQSSGVDEESYELALTSARLKPSRRRVAVAVTNPGGPDSWPAVRFGLEGNAAKPGCVRCPIPAADRMTAEEQAAQMGAFRNSPEQQMRLARGEWVELILGERVTPTFADLHIASQRIRPRPGVELVLGHDGGHTPTTIIGARYQGTLEVYASLVSEHAGTRQHVLGTVKPYLAAEAPWVLKSPSLMRHWYDPSMETGEQADIDQDPIRVFRELLGGVYLPGAVDWHGRLEPMMALLAMFNGATGRPVLQIDPVEGLGLIRALRGRAHYPTVNGRISRDLQKKPNHPWEDLLDAALYWAGGISPTARPRSPQRPIFARTITSDGLRPTRRVQYALTGARSW